MRALLHLWFICVHLKTFTFVVNYHISGFNGLTIRFTAAFRAGTYNSFLGGTTRFKQPSLHSAGATFVTVRLLRYINSPVSSSL